MLRLSVIFVCISFCLGSFVGVKMTRDDQWAEHLASFRRENHINEEPSSRRTGGPPDGNYPYYEPVQLPLKDEAGDQPGDRP